MKMLYNFKILDYCIGRQQRLQKHLAIPKLSQPQLRQQSIKQQLNSTLQSTTIKSPLFSFIFSYLIQQGKQTNPSIHLFPQMFLFDNKIQLSKVMERKQDNYIYQQIKVQNCQCFQALLTFIVKIKFIHEVHSKGSTNINTIQKLVHLVGSRTLNSHSFQTYSIIKKQLTIEQPFTCEVRYNPKGYILLKITNPQQSSQSLTINKVQIINWLSNNPIIKHHEVNNLIGTKSKYQNFRLNIKDSYALMFSMPQNFKSQQTHQIPYSIIFQVNNQSVDKQLNKSKFKIIKYFKLQ